MSISQIGRRFDLDRKTVRRCLRQANWQPYHRAVMTETRMRMPRRRLPALADGNIEERVFAVFPEVRELLRRQGMNLSGGQRKMVAIARGMALAPTLLLLDEAFKGLAPVVVKRFREAVLKIEDLGITLLIAESNLINAARIADRLYAIDRGEIIFEGKPEQALEDASVMKALRG